jgi:hypothetical protein
MNVIAFSGARMRLTENSSGFDLAFSYVEDREDRMKRLIGCLFISFMPSAGLDETISALNDYYEYHAPRHEVLPSTPARELEGSVEIGTASRFAITE